MYPVMLSALLMARSGLFVAKIFIPDSLFPYMASSESNVSVKWVHSWINTFICASCYNSPNGSLQNDE